MGGQVKLRVVAKGYIFSTRTLVQLKFGTPFTA
jgi:hypothetical protein